MLDEYGEDYLKPVQRAAIAEYGAGVGETIMAMPAMLRKHIFRKIDKRFRLVKPEAVRLEKGAAADTVPQSAVSAFEALGDYQDMLSAVAALMEHDPKFTGRIGYKLHPGSRVTWLSGGPLAQLPPAMALALHRNAVGDARKQAAKTLHGGDPSSEKLAFATTFEGKVAALEELQKKTESMEFSFYLAGVLRKGVPGEIEKLYRDLRDNSGEWGSNHQSPADAPQGGNVAREAAGRAIRDSDDVRYQQTLIGQARKNGQWLPPLGPQGGAKGPRPQGDTVEEEPRIYRDHRGLQNGVPDGGLGATHMPDRVSEIVYPEDMAPVVRDIPRTRRADPVTDARDWAFEKLRKGVPAFNAARAKLSADQEKTLKKGVLNLYRMPPSAMLSELDSEMSEEDVGRIKSRIERILPEIAGRVNALTNGDEVSDDGGRAGGRGGSDRANQERLGGRLPSESGVRGQGDRVGGAQAGAGGAGGDSGRVASAAELGAEKTARQDPVAGKLRAYLRLAEAHGHLAPLVGALRRAVSDHA
ncbi:MAG: hypothetical protein HY777_03530, partial [Betaproteobacteria bacterium]|nr:hypothetical protein [Betaproteobacteria bacterium]